MGNRRCRYASFNHFWFWSSAFQTCSVETSQKKFSCSFLESRGLVKFFLQHVNAYKVLPQGLKNVEPKKIKTSPPVRFIIVCFQRRKPNQRFFQTQMGYCWNGKQPKCQWNIQKLSTLLNIHYNSKSAGKCCGIIPFTVRPAHAVGKGDNCVLLINLYILVKELGSFQCG